jgi:hypothetical protein
MSAVIVVILAACLAELALLGVALYQADCRASDALAAKRDAERERDAARQALLNSALDRIRAAAIADTVQVHAVIVSEEVDQ